MTHPAPEASRAGCPECGDEYWDRGVGDPCPSCGHPLIPMIEAEIVEEPEAQRELESLISRIEEAREGSRELDCEIWQLLEGGTNTYPAQDEVNDQWKIRVLGAGSISSYWVRPPHYTTSLDAKLEGERITLVRLCNVDAGEPCWEAVQGSLLCEDPIITVAHTEVLARRAAALEALKARLGDNGERDR